MKRLVIIDGNAVIHRAYHALPPFTTPEGTLVNAVYGFVSMLIRIYQDTKPTHIAVAFDRKEPTFRKKLYKDYQKKRPKMDDELADQFPIVRDTVKAFGISIFDKAGYEADDVIGTIATRATSDKRQVTGLSMDQVIIVTGDKDILQLVRDDVFVYMPVKGLSNTKLYAPDDVREKLGVMPERVTDLKGLMGDASDDYPGVAGIGPKTATTLLDAHDTVEKLYKAIKKGKYDGITKGVLNKLEAGEKDAMLSKDLATIRTDVPIQVTSQQLTVSSLDSTKAKLKLQELGFKSLLNRLEAISENKKAKTSPTAQKRSSDGQAKKKSDQMSLL